MLAADIAPPAGSISADCHTLGSRVRNVSADYARSCRDRAPGPRPPTSFEVGSGAHEFSGPALVLLAPSVAMQGGPQPADLLTRSRAGRSVSPAALTATVCALAGYFTERSLRPPPPGLPTVRAFQAAQGEVTRRWLGQLW